MTNMSETRRWLAALAACAALAARGDGASADPFIGTRGPGETTPAAAWPLGMVQPGPDVGRAYRSLPSGYRGGDAHVMGFTQNHLSGTGCCDLQDYLVKPFTGEDPLAPGAVADERAEPGYYAVSLTNFGVRAEMTATRRVALYRFTFPEGKTAKVLVDTQAGPRAWWRPEAPPSRVTESASRVAPDGVFTAENTVWCWADGRRVACALAFSRKPTAVAELPSDGRAGGRWVFSFGGATDVRAACALSSVDARGARLNLASCADPFAFDARRRAAAFVQGGGAHPGPRISLLRYHLQWGGLPCPEGRRSGLGVRNRQRYPLCGVPPFSFLCPAGDGCKLFERVPKGEKPCLKL